MRGYHSAGNCLIKTASKALITDCKNSKIPTDDSVTSIGDSAFMGCSGLNKVTICNEQIAANITGENYGNLLEYAKNVIIPTSITVVSDYIKSEWAYTEPNNLNDTEYTSYSDHEHSWETFNEKATFISNGFNGKKCNSCGLLDGEIIPMLDHGEAATWIIIVVVIVVIAAGATTAGILITKKKKK